MSSPSCGQTMVPNSMETCAKRRGSRSGLKTPSHSSHGCVRRGSSTTRTPSCAGGRPYLLNRRRRDFACLRRSLPVLGVNVALTVVLNRPARFCVNLNVIVSRPFAVLVTDFKPLPLTVNLPAIGAYTVTVRVRPLIRCEANAIVPEHPSTSMGVLSWISAPFCPTNAVGIASLLVQRVPLAARAEYLPSGRFSSKVLTGTSGTVLKVLLVIPAWLMNVVPTKSTLTPSHWRTTVT